MAGLGLVIKHLLHCLLLKLLSSMWLVTQTNQYHLHRSYLRISHILLVLSQLILFSAKDENKFHLEAFKNIKKISLRAV